MYTIHIPTITELDTLNELLFERTMQRMETLADRGDYAAQRLVAQVDDIVTQAGGTFEPGLIPTCLYRHAHTRHWCGVATCRDS